MSTRWRPQNGVPVRGHSMNGAMRRLDQMFAAFQQYPMPTRRHWGWSRKITTAELAARSWQL